MKIDLLIEAARSSIKSHFHSCDMNKCLPQRDRGEYLLLTSDSLSFCLWQNCLLSRTLFFCTSLKEIGSLQASIQLVKPRRQLLGNKRDITTKSYDFKCPIYSDKKSSTWDPLVKSSTPSNGVRNHLQRRALGNPIFAEQKSPSEVHPRENRSEEATSPKRLVE